VNREGRDQEFPRSLELSEPGQQVEQVGRILTEIRLAVKSDKSV
jgi:hypothetical protein